MLLHASWEDVVFLHFIVEPQQLRRRLPEPLRLDTPLGEAWVTLVALRSRGPAPLPPRLLRGVPAFAQVNVRTYVTAEGDGEPAVFFFDQAVSSGTMAAASRLFGVQQHGAAVRVRRDGDVIDVQLGSRETAAASPSDDDLGSADNGEEGDEDDAVPARLSARVRIAGPTLRASQDPIGRHLLERYVSFDGDPPRRTRIEHAPWVIQSLEVEHFETDRLLPDGARLAAAHYGTPRVAAVGIPHALEHAIVEPLAEPA